MPQKRGSRIAAVLYFSLLLLLMLLLVLHVFGIYQLNTDFFARYLVALVFVLMLLPLIPKIKIFDVIDIKRETRMFRTSEVKKKRLK